MRIASWSADEKALVVLNLALALGISVVHVARDPGPAPATASEANAPQPTGPRKLVVLAHDNPSDAVVGQAVAEAAGAEVLAVPTTGLTDAMHADLSRSRPARVLIIGGPAVVTEDTAAALDQHALGTVRRISGADRFSTAANVAASEFSGPVPHVRIVSDDEAEALPPALLRQDPAAPVLLVRRDGIPADTVAALEVLRPRTITVLGGPSTVSDAVLRQLQTYTPGRAVQRR